MSLPAAALATLASAALLGMALPPFSLRPFAFVGLVPLLLASRSGGLARALALGGLFGIAYGWASASAFPAAVADYYERPAWFGALAGTALFGAMASVYYMAFCGVDRWLHRRIPLLEPLIVAAAWTSVELGRGRLFTGSDFFIGNPWGLIGYTHASGSLAQVAAWAGIYGIGFAIVAVNAGLAGWIDAWSASAAARRTAFRAALIATLPALVGALVGAQVLRRAREPERARDLVEVAIVQGDVELGRRWRSDDYGRNLEVYLELTRQALRVGAPRLVVWPESAMTFFLERESLYRDSILRVLRAGDVELLAGGPGQDGDVRPPVFNSVFMLSPADGILARYDKQILMPFTERDPFGSGRLLRRRFEQAGLFAPGPPAPRPLDTRIGRVGLLLCNEAMLPEIARERVLAGAEILVSPSNDGWIPDEGFAEHMLAVVGLRAIEQRRYLVRASTTGPSAIVDPWGRVVVRTPTGTRHLLRGGVRPMHDRTLYARVGDAFALGCLGLVGMSVLGLALRDANRQLPSDAG